MEVTHAIARPDLSKLQDLSFWSLLSSQCNGWFRGFRVESTAHLSMEDEVKEKRRPWCCTVISGIMFAVKIFHCWDPLWTLDVKHWGSWCFQNTNCRPHKAGPGRTSLLEVMFIFYPDVWIITQLHCSQWLLSIRALYGPEFLIVVITMLIMTSDHCV